MLINCRGSLLDLSKPKIMGILNVTPNSFYDGGKYQSTKLALKQVEQMLTDGANLIDIGACSTKPNADFVSETEEIFRLKPVLQAIASHFPNAIISVDTFRANVAKMAVNEGVAMVNDVSAGFLDPKMLQTVAQLQVPYCMMHSRGNASTMQQQTDYEDLLLEIIIYFAKVVSEARILGINDLLVDPGFGFAKTLAQNYELLTNLELLHTLELPILVGLSRKSMVYKALDTTAENALNGTTVLNTLALTKGAAVLRVHDVKEAAETIKLFQLFKK